MRATVYARIEANLDRLSTDDRALESGALEALRLAGSGGLSFDHLIRNFSPVTRLRDRRRAMERFLARFAFCVIELPGCSYVFTSRDDGDPEDAVSEFEDADDREGRTHVFLVLDALARMSGESFYPKQITTYLCDKGMDGIEATRLTDTLMQQFRSEDVGDGRSRLPHLQPSTISGFDMLKRALDNPQAPLL